MKKFLKWGTGITLVLIVIGIFLLNHFGPTLGAKVGMPIYIGRKKEKVRISHIRTSLHS